MKSDPALGDHLLAEWTASERDVKATGARRRQARLRALELRWEFEDGVEDASGEIDAIIEMAEHEHWPDVWHAGMYSALHRSRILDDGTLPAVIERLRIDAETSNDPTMLAIALGYRVTSRLTERDPSLAADADREIARATALLEEAEGEPVERVIGHNICAVAYGQRQLWELADEQYTAAEDLLTECESTRHSAVLLFNRAESQLDWACVLR